MIWQMGHEGSVYLNLMHRAGTLGLSHKYAALMTCQNVTTASVLLRPSNSVALLLS